MQIDFDKLNIVFDKITARGIADSVNATLPIPKPPRQCATCEHLYFEDKNLMIKGSLFKQTIADHVYLFVICKKCVIEAQYFGEFPEDIIMCKTCCETHSKRRRCDYTVLISQILKLRQELRGVHGKQTKRKNSRDAKTTE